MPGLPAANIVAEPCSRDTAACVGLAASIVASQESDGTMIVMPADHVIDPPEKFRDTVRAAISVIDDDPLTFVTFGIKPTRPDTGYGYIERGEAMGSLGGVALHKVVQFREKPDRATAERFAVVRVEARFVIEEIEMARPPFHAQEEHPLCRGGTMRRFRG